MADVAPDTVLAGRWRVRGVLGRGGMATVHLAEDVHTGERVALKLLHPHLVADPVARRRLRREVDAGARLDHPGVLAARGYVEDGAHVGVVLSLHTGRTLAERVATEGPLPPDQVARLARHLAEALGAAHRGGVLHRDVSARNVLLDERGGPVLTDFGLARVGETGTAGATALLGTAGYVAPEILRGERPDPRADLYGLGAVLYLAATGKEPFAAAHAQAAIRRQLDGEIAPIASTVPGFPSWLDALIRALLDPDPAKRPSGAADLVAALDERRVPTAEAREPRAASAVPVRAALPSGDFTVVVQERQDRHDTRRMRRALQKRAKEARKAERKGRGLAADAVRLVDQAALALDAITGAAAGPPIEARLAGIVARAAGLAPEALGEAAALEYTRLRLVAHVDRATAERLAEDARGLGLQADAWPEHGPTGIPGALLERWWLPIPLLSATLAPLAGLTGQVWLIFVFVAMTVAYASFVGPYATRAVLPRYARKLPVAYTDDLTRHLAPGFAAASAPDAVAPPATRTEALRRRAAAALDVLDGAVTSADLPDLVGRDLRATIGDLRREVQTVAAAAEAAEASLETDARPADAAWAAERLARLDTFARAGTPFDPAERERLLAALAAHEAAVAAEQTLEARLTGDLARLLEIDATARRLCRELLLDQSVRSPTSGLEDLRTRAAAAAAARRELAGRS